MMRIVLSETAKTDIQETLSFYRAPSQLADVFSYTFEAGARHLEQWPYTGHRRRDLTKADVCFWFEDPYLLIFQISGETLSIVAILHSSRNVVRILRQRLRKPRPTS
jgi:plasmid stabilization system protein ParE